VGVFLLSSFFPLFSSVFRGDDVKNVVNKLLWTFDMRFHSYIGGGCGTEDVRNCSHRFEIFIRHFVADTGNVFHIKNHVSCVAYVKDVTDSMQNPFSPHKTYVSHGALYLNVSERLFQFVALILFFEMFCCKLLI
jgi:hypothetical protein